MISHLLALVLLKVVLFQGWTLERKHLLRFTVLDASIIACLLERPLGGLLVLGRVQLVATVSLVRFSARLHLAAHEIVRTHLLGGRLRLILEQSLLSAVMLDDLARTLYVALRNFLVGSRLERAAISPAHFGLALGSLVRRGSRILHLGGYHLRDMDAV